MAHTNWAVIREVVKELILLIRDKSKVVAAWLDDLPDVVTNRLNKWINAYNKTYAFMLDPDQRKETLADEDEPLHQSVMKFLTIFARQSHAVSMAVKAINGTA